MKMWAVKTVHLPERVRKFNRYKRPILASLMSAVLIISIIFVGNFLLTAQSGSDGSSNSFVVYIGNATMTDVTLKGPIIYNSLQVTNVTVDVANISEMLLVKEGSRLELGAPSALATKLVLYTTYLTAKTPTDHLVRVTYYGNKTYDLALPEFHIFNGSMEVVYLQAESFSALGLSLTCV